MFKTKKIFALIALSALSPTLPAKTIDLDKEMKDSISAAGKWEVLLGLCKGFGCILRVNQYISGAQPITDVTAIDAGTVNYSPPIESPLSESIEIETYLVKNCSSSGRLLQEKILVSANESSSIVTKDSVTTKHAANGQLKASIKVVEASVGGSKSKDVSFEKTQTVTTNHTVTKETEISETIPPHTALLIEIETRLGNSFIEFEGHLNIDGWVYKKTYSELMGNSYNPIYVEGEIWNTKYKSMSKSYIEVPLPADPIECARFDIAEFLEGDSDAPIKPLSNEKDLINKSLGTHGRHAIPNVVPIQNDLVIETSARLSKIQVRAKAIQNGVCGVTFHTNNGDSIQFLATGEDWSTWKTLTTSTSAQSLLISKEDYCEGQSEAEIRYF